MLLSVNNIDTHFLDHNARTQLYKFNEINHLR